MMGSRRGSQMRHEVAGKEAVHSDGFLFFAAKRMKKALFCPIFTVHQFSRTMENEQEKDSSGAGRPTLYRAIYATQAYKLSLLGATDEKLADFFDVTLSTLYLWKKNHSKFSEALKKGREIADSNVAQSLYKRATGYEYKDTDVRTAGNVVVCTPLKKHLPPDVGAATLWLKNRQPHLWRDQKDVKHQISGPVSFIYNESPGNEPIQDLNPEMPEPQRRDTEPGEEEV